MRVAVGSKNPTKLASTQIAFTKLFPDISWQFETIAVPSGIPDQPKYDRQTIKGATNRAKRAMKALKADYGVGLEGGLHKIGKKWYETGWIVVVDQKGNKGIGSSVRIPVPEALMEHIHNGIELGEATDIVFETQGAKKSIGFFGLMTDTHITRTSAYADGVIAALSAFIHPDLH